MIRLATFLARGEVRPRLGNAEGEVIRDLTAAHGPGFDMRHALALPAAELRAAVAAAPLRRPRGACHLLPPIPDPARIFCIGKNSRTHREELAAQGLLREDPQEPTGFVKLGATLVGDGARVARPEGITSLDYEPELAFIVTRHAFRLRREEVRHHVGGITVLNDLTAREVQQREAASGTKFWTAKNMPGFCPVGPYAVPLAELDDPYALELVCTVNGEERLRAGTDEYIHRIEDILAHFSAAMPFEPGDIIATGAPRGTAMSRPDAAELYLRPGDVCVAALDRVMALTTHVVGPGEA